jgi:hypothetical protein
MEGQRQGTFHPDKQQEQLTRIEHEGMMYYNG